MPTTTTRVDLVRAKANLSLLLDRARARLSGAESPDPERGRGGEGLDGDAAQSLIQREEAFISGERFVLEIRGLLAALRRVDAGTYGVCAACSEPIPAARLKAQPTAELCMSCQGEQEGRATRVLRAHGFDDDEREDVVRFGNADLAAVVVDVPVDDLKDFPAANDAGEEWR